MSMSSDAILFFGMEGEVAIEDKDTLLDLLEQKGLALDYHCSLEYPIPFIYAEGYHHLATRGYPVEIQDLDPPAPSVVANLKAIGESLGMEGEPRWFLCSFYG